MKKIISLTLIIAVSTISIFAQTVVIRTLEDINSFNYVTVDNLIIRHINDITALSGFATLKLVKNDLIIDTNSFTSITGFDNLEHINGELSIQDNSLLKTINGFNKLESIGLPFTLKRIGTEEINGFSSLTDIYMVVIRYTQLKNVNFLSHIKTAEVGLIIENNSKLLNLDGFSNIKCVEFLSIRSNNSLENLHGLSGITKSKDTEFVDNKSLTDLSGLESLDTVETNLNIGNNANLVSVNALTNISYIRNWLAIWGNPKLSECSMIRYLVTNPTIVQGNITIYDNMPECNYRSLLTTIPLTTKQSIVIYPNPTHSESIIDFGDSNTDYTLRIYNVNGNLVHSCQNINSPFTIQWNDDQQGLYFYQISSGYSEIQSGKIVVE